MPRHKQLAEESRYLCLQRSLAGKFRPLILSSTPASVFQSCLYWTLSDLVIGFRNFKVRINAALALGSTPTRELYGQYYVPAWSAMVRALENSQNMEDYTEYKHRDQLIEQASAAGNFW